MCTFEVMYLHMHAFAWICIELFYVHIERSKQHAPTPLNKVEPLALCLVVVAQQHRYKVLQSQEYEARLHHAGEAPRIHPSG